jgi:hypothetical protein
MLDEKKSKMDERGPEPWGPMQFKKHGYVLDLEKYEFQSERAESDVVELEDVTKDKPTGPHRPKGVKVFASLFSLSPLLVPFNCSGFW